MYTIEYWLKKRTKDTWQELKPPAASTLYRPCPINLVKKRARGQLSTFVDRLVWELRRPLSLSLFFRKHSHHHQRVFVYLWLLSMMSHPNIIIKDRTTRRFLRTVCRLFLQRCSNVCSYKEFSNFEPFFEPFFMHFF